MRTLLALGALAALAALAPVASSTDYCNGNGQIIYVGAGADGPNAAYVAVDELVDSYIFSVWVYAETNGVAGLQRGGTTLWGDADICQDHPTGHDQGVF